MSTDPWLSDWGWPLQAKMGVESEVCHQDCLAVLYCVVLCYGVLCCGSLALNLISLFDCGVVDFDVKVLYIALASMVCSVQYNVSFISSGNILALAKRKYLFEESGTAIPVPESKVHRHLPHLPPYHPFTPFLRCWRCRLPPTLLLLFSALPQPSFSCSLPEVLQPPLHQV